MKKVMNGKSKKMLAGMLALSLAIPSTVWAGTSKIKEDAAAAAGKTFQLGDVDGDGSVKLADAQLALRIALHLKTPTDAEKKAADVNKEDGVTLEDAKKILRWALHLDQVPSPEPETSDQPSQTAEPNNSEEPTVTGETPESAAPSKTPAGPPVVPSSSPIVIPSKTPVPVGASLAPVSPAAYVVQADIPSLVNANGAEENGGVFTYKEENGQNEKGIQFEWPYVGKTDLIETLAQAGVNVEEFSKIPSDKLSKPEKDEDKLKWDFDYEYPRPTWNTGVSVSFWSKEEWKLDQQSNSGVLMVLKRTKYCDDHRGTSEGGYGDVSNRHGSRGDCDYSLVVRSNGMVSFLAGDEAKNGFRTTNYTMGTNNEWNHYTVTIANDWIQVYVNGQEMAYVGVDLDKDAASENFNLGFMTRYNPAGLLNQSIVDADVRKYLTSPSTGRRNSAWYLTPDGVYDTNWEATLIGNSRYKTTANFDKHTLMELLTQEGTELWFGGVETCCTPNGGAKCVYSAPTGAQIADVQCYSQELKADEVAAIYEDSLNRCKDILK